MLYNAYVNAAAVVAVFWLVGFLDLNTRKRTHRFTSIFARAVVLMMHLVCCVEIAHATDCSININIDIVGFYMCATTETKSFSS